MTGKLPDDETLKKLLESCTRKEVADRYGVTRQAVDWRVGRFGAVSAPAVSHIRDAIFDAIVRYKVENDGCAPTLDELGGMVGRVKSVVSRHVNVLAKEGRIKLLPGVRGICVPGGRWRLEGQDGD